ncbi:MAG: putative DNA binding domain-containing protein [Phycisphaeraceae bacterium]|nr:putative DNA binding domain-containing protein [Phycisphaerae bacterium]MBX3393623.1 putative DNA binding domain-containing protein [Phycisphaeraceae bacterium]
MEFQQLLDAAAAAMSECGAVDFKSAFDPAQRSDWCELIKDVVAMANSGGGCIVLGLADDGSRSTWNPTVFTQLDPAQIGDQLRRYVEGLEDKVVVQSLSRGGEVLPALVVSASPVPKVFTNPGNYDKGGGKQTQAFPKGGLYFRHGAKSEPAEQADLSAAMERAIDCVRSKWLGNIRQVMEAPPGARVQVVTSEVRASVDPAATAIRVVDDPNALAYRVVSPDDTHPYRQKELVGEINKRSNGLKINRFDVQCLRRMLDGDNAHPEFFHESKFGSKQYSPAFADYIVHGCAADPEFIVKARNAVRQPTQ